MKLKRTISVLVPIILAIMILGTPSEKQFLNRLNQDYGSIHGTPINNDTLQKIGHSSYRSYLFWSTYRYSFGNIEVNYVGTIFMTFYQGSKQDTTIDKDQILSTYDSSTTPRIQDPLLLI